MRITEQMKKDMYAILDEEKQISKLAFSEKDFADWCYTINDIVSKGYKVKTYGDYLISDLVIPQAMKQLAVPRKISVELGEEFVDLRSEEYQEKTDLEGEVLDGMKFCSISKGIVNSQRKSGAAMVDLQSLTGETLLSNIGGRYYTDGESCLRGTEPFVPIELTFNPVEDDFLSMKNTAMFKLWFTKALDEIANGSNSQPK